MALNVPGESCFVPLIVAPISDMYTRLDTSTFDLNKAWWIYNRVAEECYKKYSVMKPEVTQQQIQDEETSEKLIRELQLSLKPCSNNHLSVSSKIKENAEQVFNNWKKLWFSLIVKYNQGFKFENQDAYTLGYPPEWLENSEWKDGPINYEVPYNGGWIGQVENNEAIVKIYAQKSMVGYRGEVNPVYIIYKDGIYYLNAFGDDNTKMFYNAKTDRLEITKNGQVYMLERRPG